MKRPIFIKQTYGENLPIEWLDTTVKDFVTKNQPLHKIGDLVGTVDRINNNISIATIVNVSIPWIPNDLFYNYQIIYHRNGQYEDKNEEQIENERKKLIQLI